MLNSDNPEICPNFLRIAMKFALCPQKKCHLIAEAMEIQTRSDARKWARGQVNKNLPDPQWHHAELAGSIDFALSRIFRQI